MDNKFLRWNEDVHHPSERCISTVKTGQCPYCKIIPTENCPMHASNRGIIAQNEEMKRNYQLRAFKQRVNDFADNDQIKSLREEIGILRMVMEEVLNRCEDATDLLMASHRISDVAMKIEKLVVSCDKMETRMGMLLSKRAVIQLASQYVDIINSHITDPDIIESISTELLYVTQSIEIECTS